MASKKEKINNNSIFQDPIIAISAVERLTTLLNRDRRGSYALSGLSASARALFLYAISKFIKKKLIILCDESDCLKLFDEYRSFDRQCIYFPAKDYIFYDADLRSNELTRERMRVIQNLLREEKITVFTTGDAILGKLPQKEKFENSCMKFEVGKVLDVDNISDRLVAMGYDYSPMVTMPGEFCLRGGIFDVFPLAEDFPYRIELWDDEIDSIRSFDKDTQKSIENVQSIMMYSASEDVLLDEKLQEYSLLTDYFSDECVVFDDGDTILEMAKRSYKAEIPLMAPLEELINSLDECNTTNLVGVTDNGEYLKSKEVFEIKTAPVISFNNSIPLLKNELQKYIEKQYRTVICGQSKTRQRRLLEELVNEGLDVRFTKDLSEGINPGEIIITLCALSRGVEFSGEKLVYISENDIFAGNYNRRRKRGFKKGAVIESFRELSVGDYVVHENYGLGIYRGIEQLEQDKIIKDFIKVEYDKKSNLYIPVSKLNIITKYSGGEGKLKLSSLSSSEWKRTKNRVQLAVNDLAKELVELYALRQQDRGYEYGEDTSWQKEFEETFPFEETPGQLKAIEDVKKDLMSPKIMDRLICGDVGFGKTEIALRAAFKVVQENKQVAVLVPTTVLAQQHFNTFTERMKDYPVSVGLLSRFRTNSQNKETVSQLESGELDIVIGTHRALSKDVHFKDLGLLVIDEEQRFGVRHKERIKQMKSSVDVLSLSATPIPRTLHMSLIGIRDMSLLDEAPLERLPVQTFVFEQNDFLVREAIERELKRGGQVYYVVNRVRQIPDIADKIKTLVPSARVVYAHGQMTERDLEDIMADFVDKQIDVLVATTIIEIGLDISNVNTIIIHDADTFGLSQLYQLRGRVGRSSRTAYAFLMYNRNKMLKDVAEKRLRAIREFSELGSGFKIAMKDLEIRGAGNLLGREQHGHMESVGYELYCKLLSVALRSERGEEVMPDFETSIDIAVDAYIPDRYIFDEAGKLEIYKRISMISDNEAEDDMVDELIDRFGEIPKSVFNLIRIARLRDMAHKAYINKVKQSDGEIKITMFEQGPINPMAIPDFIEKYEGRIRYRTVDDEAGFYIKLEEEQIGDELISFLNSIILDIDASLILNIA